MSSQDRQALENMLTPLPAAYAFVIQFGRETDSGLGRFVGQIEHVVSGRQGRFANREEMLAFMDEVLAATIPKPKSSTT